jgi:hypothetical protein
LSFLSDDHGSGQDTLRHRLLLTFARGTLALQRLDAGDVAAHFRMRAGFSSWLVAAWKRRLNCSFRFASSPKAGRRSWRADLRSWPFVTSQVRGVAQTGTTLVLIGSFIARAEKLRGERAGNAVDLEQDAARLDAAAQYSTEPLPLPMRTSAASSTPARPGTRGSRRGPDASCGA